jgi:hypothetical protein
MLLVRQLREKGFPILLASLLVYLVVLPFSHPYAFSTILAQLLMSAILFFAVFAIHARSALHRVAWAVLVVAQALIWLSALRLVALPEGWTFVTLALYFAILIYAFGAYILRARTVSFNLICAALSLYLIIGMFWAAMYALLEYAAPGSFNASTLAKRDSPTDWINVFNYFSYVTLTTLGYGDITPQTESAQALCKVEAIVGQFFIAVLVAQLVGIRVAQRYTMHPPTHDTSHPSDQ